MGKKKVPDYLKNAIKNTTVSGGINVFDDENVTSPKVKLNIGKGKTTFSGAVEKPFSKVSKKNINSAITLGVTRGNMEEGDSSEFSLYGTKQGKSKNIGVSFGKTFNKGGEARGGGAAIRGKGFKGVF